MSTFDALCNRLGAHIDRRGWAHATCPECGKETRRGQSHFSFNEEYGHCFVCGFSTGLEQLAKRYDLGTVAPVALRRQEPPKPKRWQLDPERYLADYCAALDRVQAWQSYKPLSLESISRWRLGVGRLLFEDDDGSVRQSRHRRLIVPTFQDGKLTGFEGRAIHADDDGPKWICATGSSKTVLFNADLLRPGCEVIICENKVDCILAMQETPDVVVVAGGGAHWQEAWTAHIVAARPSRVIVWLDNDLAGQPNKETYPYALEQWRKEIVRRRRENARLADQPFPMPPRSRGQQIARLLQAARVPTVLYTWPAGTPWKCDLAQALMRQMEVTV